MKASLKPFACCRIAGFIVAVLLLISRGPAVAAPPGTQYPSQKIVFQDPLTGRTVWRMTTDGASLGAIHAAGGDMSSEAIAFSPDSTKIVYYKYDMNAGSKTQGVYMMDIASGVETFLAPASMGASAYPVWARDGSQEVYFYDQTPFGSGPLVIVAVNTVTYAVRTIVNLGWIAWQEKIEVNADGSYLSVHVDPGDGYYRTVIFTPQGAIHPNWTLSGPPSDDGAQWHPTDPQKVLATRGTETRLWDIDTLEKTPASPPAFGEMFVSHSAIHPNGLWWFDSVYLIDLATGNALQSNGAGYAPHPNINPTEGALGLDARVVMDSAPWFLNRKGRGRLYIGTIRQFDQTPWYDQQFLVATHYSELANNFSHPHPHWSPDGRYILWTSDMRETRDGAPPGGTGSGNRTDLFILPMEPGTPSSAPVLEVSPRSLSFTAVQGGAAPPAQSFTISNTGGGMLTWTITESAAWLGTSLTAGAGNATVDVTASPAGLAAGNYNGTITVTASGASGSPKTVAVTLKLRKR